MEAAAAGYTLFRSRAAAANGVPVGRPAAAGGHAGGKVVLIA